MKFGLNNQTIENIHSVLNQYPEIEKVLIFGSRASGNYRQGSDIDLALIGKNIDDRLLSKISLDLDELNTPYFFDLVIFYTLKQGSFLFHINNTGQIFYQAKREESTSN